MKVFLTIAGLAPEYGGPSRSVPALAEALARQGVAVELVACESELSRHNAPVLPDATLVRTQLLPARSRRGQWRASRNDFFSALCAGIRGDEPAVIHDNGLWLATNHAVAAGARSLKEQFIVSPRGMLTEWAMQFKGLKKRLAWLFYQRRDLQSAQVLHATSREEADGFRKVDLRQPIAIIPNGVELPPPQGHRSVVPAVRGQSSSSHGPDTRTVLFLSRIHPKKGLQNLVEAWDLLKPKGWHVVLAGEDSEGHKKEVQAAIRARRLEDDFTFIGPVDGEKKWELYRGADLFVLPSHTENFGLAIAEALACGVPVITTRGTPWEDLRTHDCGWWIEDSRPGLADALRDAMSRSEDVRREMGKRGRHLVEKKYSWPQVAEQMKAVYDWMLGNGERPPCVI